MSCGVEGEFSCGDGGPLGWPGESLTCIFTGTFAAGETAGEETASDGGVTARRGGPPAGIFIMSFAPGGSGPLMIFFIPAMDGGEGQDLVPYMEGCSGVVGRELTN